LKLIQYIETGCRRRAQAAHDAEVAEQTMGTILKKIKPWAEHAAP